MGKPLNEIERKEELSMQIEKLFHNLDYEVQERTIAELAKEYEYSISDVRNMAVRLSRARGFTCTYTLKPKEKGRKEYVAELEDELNVKLPEYVPGSCGWIAAVTEAVKALK